MRRGARAAASHQARHGLATEFRIPAWAALERARRHPRAGDLPSRREAGERDCAQRGLRGRGIGAHRFLHRHREGCQRNAARAFARGRQRNLRATFTAWPSCCWRCSRGGSSRICCPMRRWICRSGCARSPESWRCGSRTHRSRCWRRLWSSTLPDGRTRPASRPFVARVGVYARAIGDRRSIHGKTCVPATQLLRDVSQYRDRSGIKIHHCQVWHDVAIQISRRHGDGPRRHEEIAVRPE